jgi:hypothetical protein
MDRFFSAQAISSLQKLADFVSGYTALDMFTAAVEEVNNAPAEVQPFLQETEKALRTGGLTNSAANRLSCTARTIRLCGQKTTCRLRTYHLLTSAAGELAYATDDEEQIALAEIEAACGLCWCEGQSAGLKWLMNWVSEKESLGTPAQVVRFFEQDPHWLAMDRDVARSVLDPVFQPLPIAA